MKKLFALLTACFLSACSASTEPLDDRTYQLQNAMNEAQITISFNPAELRYAGKSAVNRYFGTYKADDNKLTLGPAGVTMMMGPQELMQAEQNYLQSLAKVVSFERKGDELTLKTADGQKLVFRQINETNEDAQTETNADGETNDTVPPEMQADGEVNEAGLSETNE